jgi:hypothetical protein
MKKLVVFVVVATIATFISAAIALACDKDFGHHFGHGWKAIHGEYSGTSVVSCNNYLSTNGTLSYLSSSIGTQLAIYTFNGDGTGTVEGKFVMIGVTPTPSENSVDFWWDFTYEVADDGEIIIHAVSGEFKSSGTDFVVYRYTGAVAPESGRFSVDHRTITIGTKTVGNTELTLYNGLVLNVKCNWSRVLIRVDK